MELLDAIILGIVQGLTEFLPVSSSGHLVMAQSLLGVTPEGGIVFEVAVHVATLVAILLFYFKRVRALTFGALLGDTDAWRYIGKLGLATLPAVLVALSARRFIEAQFNSPMFAASMLLVTGFIVFSTRYTINRGGSHRTFMDASVADRLRPGSRDIARHLAQRLHRSHRPRAGYGTARCGGILVSAGCDCHGGCGRTIGPGTE